VFELTKLGLFESLALPVHMYGLDVLFLGPVEMRKLNGDAENARHEIAGHE